MIGLDGPVPIVSYVPLFMFAVLFGLSMDYEVFLVSQIKEHIEADQGGGAEFFEARDAPLVAAPGEKVASS